MRLLPLLVGAAVVTLLLLGLVAMLRARARRDDAD